MHFLRLTAALLSTLALAPALLALPLADVSAPASAPHGLVENPVVQNIPVLPAPKTHTYTRRARAHP